MGVMTTYNEIIAFAIDKEQEAFELYGDLADRAQSPSGKILFKELADMEKGHKTKLEKLDMSYFTSQKVKPPQDLKIADYLVDVALTPDSPYQDILLFAAKREKAAFDLYTDLARIYTMTGETDLALDQIALLLSIPFELSPASLRYDPTWISLRSNPRFKQLVEGKK
jgi:rubrerythrin